MREKKTVFKLFFVWDFEKEERWLNEMVQEGWVSVAVSTGCTSVGKRSLAALSCSRISTPV